MKYLKVIITTIAVMLFFVAWSQITITTEIIEISYHDFTLDEIIDESELVIIGTFNSQKIQPNFHDIDFFPLRSKTNINVLEVLKGNYTGNTLDIISEAHGITYKNGYRTEFVSSTNIVEYTQDKKMILFLYEEEGWSSLGNDGYFVLGDSQGAYIINEDNATNPVYPERDTTVEYIRDKLSQTPP